MPSLFPSEKAVGYARVAVERGIDRFPDGLTYGVPAELAEIEPGERVLVPLGKGDRLAAGYVVEIKATCELDPESVKLIRRRDEARTRLPGQLLVLANWISRYYCAPLGVTLTAMLPAAVKKNVGAVTRSLIGLPQPSPPPPPSSASPASKAEAPPPRLSKQQRAVLDVLASLPPGETPVEMHRLAEMAELRTNAPIKRLLERGLVTADRRTTVEAAWAEHATDAGAPESLTPAQTEIVDSIGRKLDSGFSAHLLYGVTGAGKTEVYIRLIEQVVARGKVALMLVPEISLTPQTGGRLIGRFPNHRVAIAHSGLTAAQRHQQWSLVAEGTASIVLGARSAVFAPIRDESIGLIVVDEEHDGSYKQDRAPCYHGRDVAVRRADLARCPIVLGSATPSLESWHNATARGIYELHQLEERAPGLSLPRVRVVDFMEQRRARKDRQVHLLGPVLEDAIGRTLDAGRQVLVMLNRRGFANYIACPDQMCGWVMSCDDCDVTMVYHKSRSVPRGGFVQCHHCLTEQQLPSTCPDCGRRIVTFGLGTQRVEEELSRKFPELISGETMVRVDSDAIRSARDLHDVLDRFGVGVIKVLLGTQMIAKGLDYPGVGLVGVINADTALNLPDFRATERTFQIVSQVAGRCGRSTDPQMGGLVIVQSFNPETPAIKLAAAHDFRSFAEMETEERRRSGLPPFTRMARIVVRDVDHEACLDAAEAAATALRGLAHESIRIRGPAPCPIARIAGRHRQQVEILAPTAALLQQLLTTARNQGVIRSSEAMAVDVDPIALL